MKLLFHITSSNLIDTYSRVQRVLKDHDQIIFNTMTAIGNFDPPTDSSDYQRKHEEIKNKLHFGRILKGRELAFSLMAGVWNHAKEIGGIPGLGSTELLDVIYFDTVNSDVKVCLINNGHWAARWTVELNNSGMLENNRVTIEIHNQDWEEIVPIYVVQYINSAIYNYKHGMTATAVALLSIAVEATLRDMLVQRGYSYDPVASSVDVYPYTIAKVSVSDTTYRVEFQDIMPKSTTDFQDHTSDTGSLDIEIRRIIKPRRGKKDRIDLHIMAPEWFIDYWSPNEPSAVAQKAVNGLGAALRIARHIEKFLTPDILPPDFDEVLIAVRNNLIHLSGTALAEPLLMFDPEGNFSLADFLNAPDMVYDFVVNVPRFINYQYLSLKSSEYVA